MTDFIPKDNWELLPRPNLTARAPHGYAPNENDLDNFYPDLKVIEVLEKAMDYIDEGNSFRAVADWYSEEAPKVGGKAISHSGIKLIWLKHRKNNKNNERLVQYKAKLKRLKPKTKAEKELKDLKNKVHGAERALRSRREKLANHPLILEQEQFEAPEIPPDTGDIFDGREVVFKPNPGPQTEFLAASEQEVLFGGPLALNTMVMTPTGEVPIRDLNIGDEVFTSDGSITKIIDIPFIGYEDSYEIEFTNGRIVTASTGHKWRVNTLEDIIIVRTNQLLDYRKLEYYIPCVDSYWDEYFVGIKSIRYAGFIKVKCITIENPIHEIIVNGCIVTKNSAGSGKSLAMLADPMRDFDNPNFNGILFRKTNDELRELIQKSKQLYSKAYPTAKWSEQKSLWTFPSGAQFWLTYLDRDDDVERYQGQAFTWIGFDELEHWATPYAWDYMRSRLRSPDPNITLSMRASCNPTSVGKWWLKKLFIDPAPAGEAFDATDEDGNVLKYPDNHPTNPGKPLFKRRFIPSKLKDNPYLYEDGRYEASLLALPEAQRRQLLDGDWSFTEGAAFEEFNTDIHVIKPFEIPASWKRFRSCDYGYTSFAAVHWFAIDPMYETLIIYRELYVTKKTGKELAKMILELEKDERIMYGVLDSSVWHQRGSTGPSIAEEMIKEGCAWRPADRSHGSRTAGKNRLHELLKPVEIGKNDDGTIITRPGIQIFNTCRQIITDLPTLPADPKGADDIDVKTTNDHAYDSVRYGIMSRPRARSPFDFGGVEYNDKGSYRPADRKLGF